MSDDRQYTITLSRFQVEWIHFALCIAAQRYREINMPDTAKGMIIVRDRVEEQVIEQGGTPFPAYTGD
jgi:hypothetical protein